MKTEEVFNILYDLRKYPVQEKEYLSSSFDAVCRNLKARLNEKEFEIINSNPFLPLDYLVNEYLFKVQMHSKETVENLKSDSSFRKRLELIVTDKVIVNEIIYFRTTSLINKYSPVISTPSFILNFAIERLSKIKVKTDLDSVLTQSFSKSFLLLRGLFDLLQDGSETEAFSLWRTMHEVECTIKIISEHPEVIDTYMLHIRYNSAYRDEFENKEEQAATIQEIKEKLKEHDLKVKDLKKYIEYGWVYSIRDQSELYPEYKLNFRKGLEYVAGLTEYNDLYEMSSEIAHSSPLLIYSQKSFFKDITLLAAIETFMRVENMFFDFIKDREEMNNSSYISMRYDYLEEMRMIYDKQKIIFKTLHRTKKDIQD